jgi:peptide chain release factor 1
MAHLDMFDRLRQVADEYETLEHQLSDPEVLADPTQLRTLSKRYYDLGPIIEKFRLHQMRSSDRDAAREMLPDAAGDERELMQAEIDEVDAQLPALEDELREMMLPKDPYDGKNVVMEIRGAEGGEEANLFARDLYEMYDAYAAGHGWKTELLSSTLSDMGGFNEITFVVKGATAWRNLKFEGGPHRVQRVPVTESQGRIHTSSATVTALPEADEVDVSVDDRDLDIDVFRASGPGGQSVNTTDSAVRITHRPTGLVVSMQDERSQLQNKLRAMTVLRTRLFELAERERREEQSDARRSQTGGGGRSEKIRTYNFKENRVTDHRIGFTIYRLADTLTGDLQPVVDALAADERSRLLAEGGESEQ